MIQLVQPAGCTTLTTPSIKNAAAGVGTVRPTGGTHDQVLDHLWVVVSGFEQNRNVLG